MSSLVTANRDRSIVGAEIELSVVIACYMEEGHLRDSVEQLLDTLKLIGKSYELIFIEDKSTDNTAEIVRQLVTGHPNRRAVYHETNIGRGGSITEGFLLAKGRIVGFLDIDLEVHCRFLPSILNAIEAGADGATALRRYSVQWWPKPFIRHLLSISYRWLFGRIFNGPFKDPETGFKFFRRDKITEVVKQTKDVGWFWDSEILILSHQAGMKIEEVPCQFERRPTKVSTVRILHDTRAHLIAIRKFRKRNETA